MKKILFILIILLTFMQVCKKYPDDPFIARFSSKKKLLAGDQTGNHWTMISVYIDGIDSTEQFKLYGCGCDMNIDYDMDDGVYFSDCSNNPCGVAFAGWGLDKNNNLLMEGYLVYPTPIKILNPYQQHAEILTHHILKLYDCELKFLVTHPSNGKEYIYEFAKKK